MGGLVLDGHIFCFRCRRKKHNIDIDRGVRYGDADDVGDALQESLDRSATLGKFFR